METSFDPTKDAENVRRRGLPLSFGAVVIADAVGVVEDERRDYGEARFKAFAEIEGLWFVCVYTMHGDVYRIITVHRVRLKEVNKWLKES